MQRQWADDARKYLICVDSYHNSVLSGWLYSPFEEEGHHFLSLSQLLLSMEQLLDANRLPQAYSTPRRFCDVQTVYADKRLPPIRKRGNLATFELSILFRQYSSWQGLLKWQEKRASQSFRSVLELIFLIDSALRAE